MILTCQVHRCEIKINSNVEIERDENLEATSNEFMYKNIHYFSILEQ